ncbi:MAG: SCO family protein [Acidimicrobiales bacterium]
MGVTFRDVRPAPLLALAPKGPFRTRAAPGGLLLVYFGYTFCPDVCPTTLTDLAAALDQLGDDASKVTLAMVTIDPDRDDLDTLAAYLGHFSDRFVAVRPHDPAELRAAESAYLASSSVVRSTSGDVEVSHSATVYLVDELGEVRVEWPFGTTPDTVAHDLRAVLQDIEGKNRS